MSDLTVAAIVILTAGGLTAVIGFPLAMLDNPERRRRRKNRSR